MKIYIATVASQTWSMELAGQFHTLAARDRFGVHTLVHDPEKADALLFVDLHQLPNDWSLSTLRQHPLARKYARKVLVYNERDHPWCEWPGIYVSMPGSGFDSLRQRAYSYFEIKTDMMPCPASRADLLFSFQGGCSHSSRRPVLALSHPRAHIEDTSRINFFDFSALASTPEYQARVREQKARYQEIVARSKFVLCPRGMGNSSFRLYETLAAGRVPVIISDEWVEPQGPGWSACSLRVPESQVASLPRLLEEKEADFEVMAQCARETFESWFAPDVMFHRVAECCHSLVQQGKPGPRPSYFLSRPFRHAALRHAEGRVRTVIGKQLRKIRPRSPT